MSTVDVRQFLRFFFTTDGRITRQEYGLGAVFIYAVNATLFSVALHQSNPDLALGLAIMISTFPSTVAIVVLAAKRCHDIGLTGWLAVGALIPFVGFLWVVILAFIRGNAGANAYGPPPRFDPV